ncbi:MAG: GNAT family N-acetyltransferase [Planctomycetota bacterium]|jgi:GNAT superfamily N-acetyltransferase
MKTIPVKTHYLEMLTPPSREVPSPTEHVDVERAEPPSIPFYRSLYDVVGRDWNWVDRKRMSDEELRAIIHDERVEVYVLRVAGRPAGFCEMDRRDSGQVELVYFGLTPEFIGKGLGTYFLHWVLRRAWSYGPKRVWLHTCELDHQAALPVYLRAGFVVFDCQLIDQPIP